VENLDYSECYRYLAATDAAPWLDTLPQLVEDAQRPEKNGHFADWQAVLNALPNLPACDLDLAATTVKSLSPYKKEDLRALLQQLHPWRKGPYSIHGLHIDTEWRSDWKWQRLAPHIRPLQNKLVLDVGCGNGYHAWRMLAAGAAAVIGIDPSLLFAFQWRAVKHFFGAQWPVWVLPVGIEAVPPKLQAFDSVFSMGVLYHRKSPIDHLLELRDSLKPGGELVLETLVIEQGDVLVPHGRYARMRNVWFIPSCEQLIIWLSRCGFQDSRVVDVTPTSIDEQRSTDWMRFESLRHCLNPANPRLTVEGYPAPVRATLVAQAR
jgi:tRNA (mo5U34)-methyltransferase